MDWRQSIDGESPVKGRVKNTTCAAGDNETKHTHSHTLGRIKIELACEQSTKLLSSRSLCLYFLKSTSQIAAASCKLYIDDMWALTLVGCKSISPLNCTIAPRTHVNSGQYHVHSFSPPRIPCKCSCDFHIPLLSYSYYSFLMLPARMKMHDTSGLSKKRGRRWRPRQREAREKAVRAEK